MNQKYELPDEVIKLEEVAGVDVVEGAARELFDDFEERAAFAGLDDDVPGIFTGDFFDKAWGRAFDNDICSLAELGGNFFAGGLGCLGGGAGRSEFHDKVIRWEVEAASFSKLASVEVLVVFTECISDELAFGVVGLHEEFTGTVATTDTTAYLAE